MPFRFAVNSLQYLSAKGRYIQIFGVPSHLFQSVIMHTLPVILALKYSQRTISQGSQSN